MKHDHFVRDQSCTDPERRLGGGGNRWPGLALKITSSIGNKQLSSTPTPGNVGPPLEQKHYIFSEFTEYSEGMSNMLGVSIYWTVEYF